MKKIPTLYARDFDHDPRYVTRDVTPGCEWVLKGEGAPTRKYDGTCVMFDGGEWWARREVKKDKMVPPGFAEIGYDDETGKTVGWEPAGQSGFSKWLAEAASEYGSLQPGTYEMVGPKVNGNPEKYLRHHLIRHAVGALGDSSLDYVEALGSTPLDFDGLASWLHAHEYEGIVWHHPDGRMAKLKKRDFPRPVADLKSGR